MKRVKFVSFCMILLVLVLAVSMMGGASAAPDVNESTISVDVLSAANDSFVLRGETLRVSFNFTEALNATPDAEIDLWIGGSKNLSRNMGFHSESNSNVSYVFDYVINSSDPDADYLEINVGNACNSSGDCGDPSPKRINVSIVSRETLISVSSASNLIDAVRKTESGGKLNFSAGVYRDAVLTFDKPMTLVSDTGDYRTSGVVFTGSYAWQINSNNVTVKGFRFENVTPLFSGGAGLLQERGVIKVGGGHSNLRFEKNKFTNVSGQGINLIKERNENVSIIDNEYLHSTECFIRSSGFSHSVIEDNVINNVSSDEPSICVNAFYSDSRNLSFLNNKINGSGWGFYFFTTPGKNVADIYVKGNVIENVDPIPPHTYNVDEFKAVFLTVGPGSFTGVIENNTIVGNHDAIILCNQCKVHDPSQQSNSGYARFTLMNNRIYSNTGGYDLVNSNRNPVVQAAYNYWGSSRGPSPSRLFGNVNHSPFYLDDSMNDLGFVVDKANLVSGESNVFWFNESEVVENVGLDLGGNVSSARMVAGFWSSKPENVSGVSSSREVYGYVEITGDVDDSLVEGADVVFKVPKSWLNSNNVDEDEVVLLRHDDGSWDDLDTRMIDENSDEVIFSARTPGFSFFAIADAAPSSSSSSAGGGGSGGGRGATFSGFVKVRGKTATTSGTLNEGELSEYDLRNKGLSVREVRMALNETTYNVPLTVAELKRRSTTEKPTGDVHHYFGIHLGRSVERSVERFTVTFAVNESWLQATGFEKDEVVLLAREGNEWMELNVEPGAENPAEIEFSADVPVKRTSVFAVTGRKREAEKVIVVPEEKDMEDGTDGREINPQVPVTDEAGGGGFLTWFWRIVTLRRFPVAWFWRVPVVVVILVAVLVAFRFLRRK